VDNTPFGINNIEESLKAARIDLSGKKMQEVI
jgi:hypothetical protein